MQEQRQTIYTSHEERRGHRSYGGLSGAWRGDQVSIAKEPAQKFPAPAQRVDKPILSFRGAPQGYLLRGAKRRGNPQSFSCKFAEKRKIVRFGNRLPRQSADWLAMTGFFDSLKRTALRRFFQLVDKPALWGQRFFYAGGARGGKARLELDQMSRKALPCKACVERIDYFRAARQHKNNDIISGCRKSQRLFRQPRAPA